MTQGSVGLALRVFPPITPMFHTGHDAERTCNVRGLGKNPWERGSVCVHSTGRRRKQHLPGGGCDGAQPLYTPPPVTLVSSFVHTGPCPEPQGCKELALQSQEAEMEDCTAMDWHGENFIHSNRVGTIKTKLERLFSKSLVTNLSSGGFGVQIVSQYS